MTPSGIIFLHGGVTMFLPTLALSVKDLDPFRSSNNNTFCHYLLGGVALELSSCVGSCGYTLLAVILALSMMIHEEISVKWT
jgi:hypothetical protein